MSKFSLKFNVAVFFLLGNSPASEFYKPTFRHIKFRCYTSYLPAYVDGTDRAFRNVNIKISDLTLHAYLLMKMEQIECSKRRHIKFRRRGITRKKV